MVACGGGGDSNLPASQAAPTSFTPPASTPAVAVVASATLLRAFASDTIAPLLAFSARPGGALSAQKTSSGTQVDVKISASNYRSIFDASGVRKETVNVSTGEKVKVELAVGRY